MTDPKLTQMFRLLFTLSDAEPHDPAAFRQTVRLTTAVALWCLGDRDNPAVEAVIRESVTTSVERN